MTPTARLGWRRRSTSPGDVRPEGHSVPILRVAEDWVTLGDLKLTSGPFKDVTAALERLVEAGGAELVVTVNVDQILSLRAHPRLAEAYATAALRLIDGMPIVYLARLLGAENVHRHTGADLLPRCAALAQQHGWRIVIAGGADDVGRQAAARLRIDYPGAEIEHVSFPMVRSVDDPATHRVLTDLHRLDPDLVFLCLGSPKQEDWFLQWRHDLPGAVYIGTGAAVDFAAGAKVRAPSWIQSSGLEWVWRLVQEPRRLAYRYLVRGPGFLQVVVRSWANGRNRRNSGHGPLHSPRFNRS